MIDLSVNEPFRLGPFLDQNRILIFHGKQEKTNVLNAMIDRLADIPEINGRDDLARSVFLREGLLCTAIGNAIAVPHARIQELEQPCLALAVCPDGITDYFSPDSMPVRLVFLPVTGSRQNKLHVKIISCIGKLFFDGRLKAAFLAAKDAQTCIETIYRTEAKTAQ